MKGKLLFCAGRWLVLLGLVSALVPAYSQSRPIKERVLPGAYPQKPSLPSMAKIAVEPLGFTPPGPLYLGQRNSLVSLDFMGEDRLLFTFRVPGLIHRQLKVGESDQTDERQIRAVVLHLPDGMVEAEGLWTVHDRGPYVWMLKDGHFLFRDQENLAEGDAHLDMKPLLQFPGPLLWLEVDPSEQFLVSNSSEPAAKPAKAGNVDSPATAQVTLTPSGEVAEGDAAGGVDSASGQNGADKKEETPSLFDNVVRILRRDGGQVLLVSRVRQLVHLPINSQGYLESLRGRGLDWALNLNFFSGGSRVLGNVESSCAPNLDFLSDKEVIATGCDTLGAHKLVAVTTEGKTLWADLNPDTAIWPLLVRSADGQRLIQETLMVNRPINSYSPLSADDIKGQLVRVFDAATGEQVFESPANPILDAGGNVALSPTSRRVAVLNGGELEVFDLPAPAAMGGAQKAK